MRDWLTAFVLLGCGLLAVLTFALLTGCSAHGVALVEEPPVTTYTVIVDDAFTLDEQTSIAAGADAWAAAVGPDLTFGYVTASRAQIDAALDRAPKLTTVYVVRVESAGEIPSCLLQAELVGCYLNQRVWLAASDIGVLRAWAKIPMHEIGHFLGLPHTTQGSVMREAIVDMAFAPTSTDVASYCRLHACPRWSPYPAK